MSQYLLTVAEIKTGKTHCRSFEEFIDALEACSEFYNIKHKHKPFDVSGPYNVLEFTQEVSEGRIKRAYVRLDLPEDLEAELHAEIGERGMSKVQKLESVIERRYISSIKKSSIFTYDKSYIFIIDNVEEFGVTDWANEELFYF